MLCKTPHSGKSLLGETLPPHSGLGPDVWDTPSHVSKSQEEKKQSRCTSQSSPGNRTSRRYCDLLGGSGSHCLEPDRADRRLAVQAGGAGCSLAAELLLLWKTACFARDAFH